MPVLDTVVLFGAADPKDPVHEKSVGHLARLTRPDFYLATSALLEFDIVMKSRGFTPLERTERHALLARDFPMASVKVRPLTPEVLYLTARVEEEAEIDYFDASVAAESMTLDAVIVSTDRVFDRLKGVKRIW